MRQSQVFTYPTIQYIPLRLEILYRKEPWEKEAFFLIGPEIYQRENQLRDRYGIDLPRIKEPVNKLLLLAGGLELLRAKYRGYYVTIEGGKSPAVNLYQIPSNYFYKETLVFQIKNTKGDLLISRIYRKTDEQIFC